jgi:tetratricopeptide (TPR) repeat protein
MGATGAAAVELQEAVQLAEKATSGVKTGPMQGAAAGADSAAAAGAAVSPRASAAAAAVALLTPSPATAAARRSGAGGSAATLPGGADQQQPPQPEQFQYSSNIVTAWKLLGDILVQQHLLQPAAAAAARETSADADAAVAAALDGLVARQGLLARARRAYAHALMLNPAAGEVWGDVAQCYSHEARLLLELQPHTQQQQQQQQGASASAATDAVAAARAAAVRTARGGLRLAPASSWLWGVLAGAAASAGDPAAAEYAYSRALALDPKAAMLWVQLGRLYSRYGSGERLALPLHALCA